MNIFLFISLYMFGLGFMLTTIIGVGMVYMWIGGLSFVKRRSMLNALTELELWKYNNPDASLFNHFEHLITASMDGFEMEVSWATLPSLVSPMVKKSDGGR